MCGKLAHKQIGECNHVIQEIHETPPEKLMGVYNIIHQFRLNLSTHQPKKYKMVDDVFGKLYRKVHYDTARERKRSPCHHPTALIAAGCEKW